MNNRKFFTADSYTFHADGYVTSVFAVVEASDKDDAITKLRKKFPEQSPNSWIIEDVIKSDDDVIIWHKVGCYKNNE
jgi:hypothetical protein